MWKWQATEPIEQTNFFCHWIVLNLELMGFEHAYLHHVEKNLVIYHLWSIISHTKQRENLPQKINYTNRSMIFFRIAFPITRLEGNKIQSQASISTKLTSRHILDRSLAPKSATNLSTRSNKQCATAAIHPNPSLCIKHPSKHRPSANANTQIEVQANI